MDNRGTGRSAAVDCRQLQEAAALTLAAIGACGHSLGASAGLYSTALAADDLAAVLDALEIGQVNLYGDSYGTYFSQVFALRHPQRLRSLVLDGAYPLDGPDYAWYPHYAPAMREKFNRACERTPECRALPGNSMAHIAPALEQLRAKPFAARVRLGERHTAAFTADATQLAIVMFGERTGLRHRARDGCRGARLRGRGPAAAAAPHGGNTRRGATRAIRRTQRRSSAPDLRRRSRAGIRRRSST